VTRLTVVTGDITKLALDAIVNAANSTLLGGGGVDGAIHRAAGPALLEACRTLGGCPPGEARITQGFQLPAAHVIHTVGPVWQGGGQNEEKTLASCYSNSLALGTREGLRCIAFPCISTGVYGFPADLAARIAVKATRNFLAHDTQLQEIIFCCFLPDDAARYRTILT